MRQERKFGMKAQVSKVWKKTKKEKNELIEYTVWMIIEHHWRRGVTQN